MGAGNQVQNNFTVAGGLEDGTVALQLLPHLLCIDQVAIMTKGQVPFAASYKDRLGILQGTLTSRGIAGMTNGNIPFQLFKARLLENISHVPHPLFRIELTIIGRYNAGALLTTMLERIQSQIGDASCVCMFKNPEDATFFVKLVVHIDTS